MFVGTGLKRATGGDADLLALHAQLSKQTLTVEREAALNRFGRQLFADALLDNEMVDKHVLDFEEYKPDPEEYYDEDNKKKTVSNEFVVYEDGKAWKMTVDNSLFEGIAALRGGERDALWLRILGGMNKAFKKGVTGWDPTFAVRNFVKDLQDVVIYSKNLPEFGKNLPLAYKEIASNGKYWRQYKALGGLYTNRFNWLTGEIKEQGKISNAIDKMNAVNEFVEQAPRLAEFMATVKNGDGSFENLQEAMYNSADVTVNFGRGGTWSKNIDRYAVPFFNASVQGLSKTIRSATEMRGIKAYVRLASKAVALGLTPTIIGALLHGGDDDWEKMTDREKDTYYHLWKTDEGKWVKIPKGRLAAILQAIPWRVASAIRGRKPENWNILSMAQTQIGVNSPVEGGILQAWKDADLLNKSSTGMTWYGTPIESRRLQNLAPGQRYDAGTDAISKLIGKLTNLSPKKISYILNQYTGVFGDIVLPLLTERAESKIPVLGAFANKFVVDPTASNRITNDFYKQVDKLTWAHNEPDASAETELTYKFINKVNTEVNEINKMIRGIETDKTLTDKEKNELVRAQQAIRNNVMQTALDNLGTYTANAAKNAGLELSAAKLATDRETFGAEYAAKANLDEDTFVKAQDLNLNVGIGYDVFLDVQGETSKIKKFFEAANKGLSDEEKENSAVSKNARIKVVAKAKLTDTQKTELAYSLGILSEKQADDVRNLVAAGTTWANLVKAAGTENDFTVVTKYLSAGIAPDSVQKLSTELAALKPKSGKKTVSDVQRYRVAVNVGDTPRGGLAILEEMFGDGDTGKESYKRVETASSLGVTPKEWVTYNELREKYDANGNGSYSKAEIMETLRHIAGLSQSDKAVLYQMAMGKSTKAENNPYSVGDAARYRKAVGWD